MVEKTTFDRRRGNGSSGIVAASLTGLTMTAFVLGAMSVSLNVFQGLGVADFIGAVAAIASTVAAVAAAYSAKFTREGAVATQKSAAAGLASAEATRDTVAEMRKARREEQRPRLTIEQQFIGLSLVWPLDLANQSDYKGTKSLTQRELSDPVFRIENHSDAPAFDVSVEFLLIDDNGSFDIGRNLSKLRLSYQADQHGDDDHPTDYLMFRVSSAGSMGRPLYRRIVDYFRLCGPRQSRLVKFPEGVLNTLFLRGAQSQDRAMNDAPIRAMQLVVTIRCYTIANDEVEFTYQFEAFPFCNHPASPLAVHCHFHELPNNPVPDRRPR